jgi:arylsulfatase G
MKGWAVAATAAVAAAAITPASASTPASTLTGIPASAPASAPPRPRGVVIFLVDDNGYGDLGAMGYMGASETPHLDALASSGVRFLDFHAMPLCTPSRAQLMTGRLGPRTDLRTNFGVTSLYGLNTTELLLSEFLTDAGFSSRALGKWHLGHNERFHPTYRGFESFVGLPASVDNGCVDAISWFTPNTGADLPYFFPCRNGTNSSAALGTIPANATRSPGLSLMNATRDCGRGVPGSAPRAATTCSRTIVAQPADLTALTDVYTAEAVRFIEAQTPESPPFFLYFAFSHTHAPLAYARRFANASTHKTLFYDTMREVDASVGAVIAALGAAKLLNDTLVFAFPDNGPPISQCEWAGHVGPFTGEYQSTTLNRGGSAGKGTTWEGGHRVWSLVSYPRAVAGGRVSRSLTSTLDVFPTIASLVGRALPADRVYDGVDLSPILFGDADAKVRDFLFIPDCVSTTPNITAVRWGNLSVYLQTNSQDGCRVNFDTPPVTYHEPWLAFDLGVDPAQAHPVALSPAQVAAVRGALHDVQVSIATTFRTSIDYSTSTAALPCCEPSAADCRCTPLALEGAQ